MKKRIFTFAIIMTAGLWTPAVAAPVQGLISSQNDTVHVEFTGRESWDYELKKVQIQKKNYMKLVVEPLDEKLANQLKNFKSPFIKSVKIEQGPDKKDAVLFELAHEGVESFDYLTDQPSRLIIDFFVSNQPVAPTKTAATKKPAPVKKAKEKVETAEVEETDSRKPASTDILVVNDQGSQQVAMGNTEIRAGIFDGGDPDFERFSIKDYEINEQSILKAKENYYIPFPMLELENTNWNRVKAAAPEYNIVPKDTDENKQARLLLTLFKKQRYQVYLKTLEWFKEKYPDSEYNEVIYYMTADVYYKLWQAHNRPSDFDLAIESYKDAVRKFPKSALAERVSLMLGYLQLDRGDSLSAIKNLNEHIRNESFGGPHVFSKDLARIGVYLGYLNLNKFNEAYETLNEIEKESPHMDLKTEAAYRKGDVFVRSKDFARAVEEYQRAMKTYPAGQPTLPNAYFNQAESLFLLEKYRQSLDTFKEFAKRFPSDNHAPFALTRLGELLDILGADRSRSMGAYLETYFRYGNNPSAIISRLRLLSARMKGMKPKEVETTVKEILSLAQNSELPGVQQFATVMIADGYNQRGEYQKSLDLLINFYQQNPSQVDEKQIRKRIVSNINDKMRVEIEKGNFIAGLKTHQKYADNWLKSSDRLDTPYYLGRAFEAGGVYNEAEKYYQSVLNSYYAALNTEKQKEISVLEHLPSLESLNLRMARVSFLQGDMSRSYDHLKNIKNPEKMSEPEQIERVSLAVNLLEKRGDTDSAIRYLTELLKTWKGIPALLAEPYLKLADLELRAGRKDDAKKSLEKVDLLMKDSGQVPETIHAGALEKLANLQYEDKETDKSIKSYQALLDNYEEKRPLSSIRYKLGKIFFDRGEIQKAADVWSHFKNDESGMWEKLAQEELKGVEWQADYKKYLKRIPAMAGKEQ